FGMGPFATDHERRGRPAPASVAGARSSVGRAEPGASSRVTSALRRCRQPIPARVAVDRGDRPVRVTSDRRGFAGGTVASCTGPWRSSGYWWAGEAGGPGRAGEAGRAGGAGEAGRGREAGGGRTNHPPAQCAT